jgi:microcystin-dependent protein
MSDPYIGEIRMFAGNFPPNGWAFCEGQLLAISEYDTLYALIGTTYGGDGQTTFALPDFRGRIPVHQGQGPGLSHKQMGEQGGTETVTLGLTQLPIHTHALGVATSAVSQVGNSLSPTAKHWSRLGGERGYGDTANVALATDAITAPVLAGQGGSQPHNNLVPYLCVNFIISLFGIFPSQS